MADKLSFELDAGKVLAKLHFGGCQTHPQFKFFNTGIIDNQSGVTPETADKAKTIFDMDNKSGEYELGVVITKDAIKMASAEQLKKELEKIQKDAAKKGGDEKAGDEKTGDEKDGDEKAGDEKNGSDGKETDEKDEKAKAEQDAKTPITQNPDDKKTNESRLYEADRAADGTAADKAETGDSDKGPHRKDVADEKATNRLGKDEKGDQLYLTIQQMGTDAAAYDQVLKSEKFKNLPAEVQKLMQTTADDIRKKSENLIEVAAVYLTDYMTVFCGADEAKKITKDKVQSSYLPPDAMDPYKIKKYDKYQIPAMTDEEVRKYKVDWLKKNANAKEVPVDNMCFKIGYSIDLGK